MARPKKDKTTQTVFEVPTRKAKAEVKVVTPARLNLRTVTITIKGKGHGIISNNYPEETKTAIIEKAKGTSGAPSPTPRDPQAEFRGSLRILPGTEGTDKEVYCLPGGGFRRAMCACANEAGLKQAVVARQVQVLESFLPIIGSKPYLRRDSVKKGRLTHRACFPCPWKVKVPIVYNANRISIEQIIDLLNLAGFCEGIGGWRPGRNGSMGMFEVDGTAVDETPAN